MKSAVAIPAEWRETVQGLKEIVNRPLDEIYAMFKECDMDPSETINRLLSQDTFHEVKSKRERKKELKEMPDRYRGSNQYVTSWHSEHAMGRTAPTFTKTDEPYQPGQKKENEPVSLPLHPLAAQTATIPINQSHQQSYISNSDSILATNKERSEYQPALSRSSGQVTMADVVRTEKPQCKMFRPITDHVDHEEWPESTITQQHIDLEPWPVNEQESGGASLSTPSDTKICSSHGTRPNPDPNSNPNSDPNPKTNPGPNSNPNPDPNPKTNSDPDQLLVQSSNDEVSSTTTNFQQLSLNNEDQNFKDEVVVIPNHLQVSTATCSHLNFGTFIPCNVLKPSNTPSSSPTKNDLDELSSSVKDDQFGYISGFHGLNMDDHQPRDPAITSQPKYSELSLQESTGMLQDDFGFSSLSDYDIEIAQQLHSNLNYPQSKPHIVDSSVYRGRMVLNSDASERTYPRNVNMHSSYAEPKPRMRYPSNISDVPINPHSYAHIPSDIKQVLPGSRLAHPLQKYSTASANGLPSSDFNASDYRRFENLTNAGLRKPPPYHPTYDEIPSSFYQGGNQYQSLQKDEKLLPTPMYGHGRGSRTSVPVPDIRNYNFQNYNQQSDRYQQQAQQQSRLRQYDRLEYSDHLYPQNGGSTRTRRRSVADQSTENDIQNSSVNGQYRLW